MGADLDADAGPDLFGAVPPTTRRTHVLLPDGRRLRAHYRVIPLDRILTSHRVEGAALEPQDGYPRRIQFREYAGPRGRAATLNVFAAAAAVDPDQLLDPTHTAVAGPPLVATWPFTGRAGAPEGPDGTLVCVAGNQRCMLLVAALTLGVSARRHVARYVRDLRRRVRALGMDEAPLDRILGRRPDRRGPDLRHPDDERPDDTAPAADDGADPEIDGPVAPAHTPVLVRVLEQWAGPDGAPDLQFPRDEPARAAAFGRINRASDGSFTKARDLTSLAYTLAADVRDVSDDLRRASDLAADALPVRTPLGHLMDTLPAADSLSEYFKKAEGRACFHLLLHHRVVARTDRAAYEHPRTKQLTRTGQTVLVAMVSALALGDPAIEDAAPGWLLDRIQRSLPDLLATSQCAPPHDDWHLARPLGDAVALLGAYGAAPPAATATSSAARFTAWVTQQGQGLFAASTTPGAGPKNTGPTDTRPTGQTPAATDDGELPTPDAAALALFLIQEKTGDAVTAAIAAWKDAASAAGAIPSPLQGDFWPAPRTRTRPGRPSTAHAAIPSPAGPEGPSDAFARIFCRTADARALRTRVAEEHARRAAYHLTADGTGGGGAEHATRGATRGAVDARPAPAAGSGTPADPAATLPDENAIVAKARAVWEAHHAATPAPGAAPDAGLGPARGRPREFDDAAVFATYVLADRLGRPLRDVTGLVAGVLGAPKRPTARTCQRRLAAFWRDPATESLLTAYLTRTAAHRRARPPRAAARKAPRRTDREAPPQPPPGPPPAA